MKTKFSINDKVYIEYKGRILQCRVYGVQFTEEIEIICNNEDYIICDGEINKTIYYIFYIDQYDNTKIRRRILYKEENVYSSKEELIKNIKVEAFL